MSSRFIGNTYVRRSFSQIMERIVDIEKEYTKRRDDYFKAREAFNTERRKKDENIEKTIWLSEEYGYRKALWVDYKERYGHLIVVGQ